MAYLYKMELNGTFVTFCFKIKLSIQQFYQQLFNGTTALLNLSEMCPINFHLNIWPIERQWNSIYFQ